MRKANWLKKVSGVIAGVVLSSSAAPLVISAVGSGPCPDVICGMNHNQLLL